MHHLEKFEPRFITIVFNHCDGTTHYGYAKTYHDTLERYTKIIKELFGTFCTLKKMGKHGKNTTVILTMDYQQCEINLSKKWKNSNG
jgi:hypothetical protein